MKLFVNLFIYAIIMFGSFQLGMVVVNLIKSINNSKGAIIIAVSLLIAWTSVMAGIMTSALLLSLVRGDYIFEQIG